MAIWLACLGAQQRSAGASGTYEMPLSYVHANQSTGEIKEILRSKGLRLGMPREEAVASIESRARAVVMEGGRVCVGV